MQIMRALDGEFLGKYYAMGMGLVGPPGLEGTLTILRS